MSNVEYTIIFQFETYLYLVILPGFQYIHMYNHVKSVHNMHTFNMSVHINVYIINVHLCTLPLIIMTLRWKPEPPRGWREPPPLLSMNETHPLAELAAF